MKTQVIMKRQSLNELIKQESKSGYFNAKDIMTWINSFRKENNLSEKSLLSYWQVDQTQDFINELSNHLKIDKKKLKKTSKGRFGGTWIHPYIAIDLAMWGHPKLKVHVIEWVHDNLLKYRNDSGDSFKDMNKALDMSFNIGGRQWVYCSVANKVAKACGLDDSENRWQNASEEQLKLRDKIQADVETIAYVRAFDNPFKVVDAAIDKNRCR